MITNIFLDWSLVIYSVNKKKICCLLTKTMKIVLVKHIKHEGVEAYRLVQKNRN